MPFSLFIQRFKFKKDEQNTEISTKALMTTDLDEVFTDKKRSKV